MKVLVISSLLLVAVYGGPVQEEDFQKIIEIVNSSGAKWKAGQNFGKNTTVSSLKSLMGVKQDGLFQALPLREKHDIPDSEIPESFDARETWPACDSIRHIRDQGNCSSGWAVAAAGAFSDRLCIATNGTFNLPLSSEELLACCSKCGFGCGGGFRIEAWKYFASNGLVTGGDYQSNVGCQPYEVPACSHHTQGPLPPCDTLPRSDTPECKKECTNPAYPGSYSSDHHKIGQAYMVTFSVEEIQKEIMTYGPVEATFTINGDFPTYKSGVYHHVTGWAIGEHTVKIIGWGVEDSTPYWIVANQWNESWGDNGFFKILRGNDECGIESQVIAGIPQL